MPDGIGIKRDIERRPEAQGIGGWLTFYLFVHVLIMCAGAARAAMPIFDGALFGSTRAGDIAAASSWSAFFSLLAGTAIFGGGLICLVRFAQKRRSAPRLMVKYFVLLLVIRMIEISLIPRYPLWFETGPVPPEGLDDIIYAIVGTVIWTSYFLSSERVKATFVN